MFVVKYIGEELFVHSFDRRHEVIVSTHDVNAAKSFKTFAAAEKWVASYSGCGYGLSSSQVVIVRP